MSIFPISPTNATKHTTINGTKYVYDVARNAWNKSASVDNDLLSALGMDIEAYETMMAIETSPFTGVSGSTSTKLVGHFNEPIMTDFNVTAEVVGSVMIIEDYTVSSGILNSKLLGDYSSTGMLSSITVVAEVVDGLIDREDFTTYGSTLNTSLVGSYSESGVNNVVISDNVLEGLTAAGTYTTVGGSIAVPLVGDYSATLVTYTYVIDQITDGVLEGGDYTVQTTSSIELTT